MLMVKGKSEGSPPFPTMNSAPFLSTLGMPFQGVQEIELAEQGQVARQQRFADVEAREPGTLQEPHPQSGAGHDQGGGRSGGAAADDDGVVGGRIQRQHQSVDLFRNRFFLFAWISGDIG